MEFLLFCTHPLIHSISHKICTQFWCAYFYLWFVIRSHWTCVINLPIFLRIASQVLGQSYDCPSASEGTLKKMGNTELCLTKTKQNAAWTVSIFSEMCCLGIHFPTTSRQHCWPGNLCGQCWMSVYSSWLPDEDNQWYDDRDHHSRNSHSHLKNHTLMLIT